MASADERALLIFSLRNPQHQNATCSLGMLHIFNKCFAPDAEKTLQPAILRVAMSFLVTWRGPELTGSGGEDRFPEIMESMRNCSCKKDFRDSPFHATSRDMPNSFKAWSCLLPRLCDELIAALRPLKRGEYRAKQSGLAPEDQPWPSSEKDIVPPPPFRSLTSESYVAFALFQWAFSGPRAYLVLPLVSTVARFSAGVAHALFTIPLTFENPPVHLATTLRNFCEEYWAVEEFVETTTSVVRFFRELEELPGRRNFVMSSYRKNANVLLKPALRVNKIAQSLADKHPELADVRAWCAEIKTLLAPSSSPSFALTKNMTVADEVALLTFSLLDPLSEDSCCAIALLHIINKCFGPNASDSEKGLQPVILRAGMKFLATFRGDDGNLASAEDNFDPIIERMIRCECTPAVLALRCHTAGGPDASPFIAFSGFLSKLSAELASSLLSLKSDTFRPRIPGLPADDPRQPWPRSRSEISPPVEFDLDNIPQDVFTAYAFIQWATDGSFNHVVLRVVSAVAHYSPLFAAALLSMRTTYERPTSHLLRAARDFPSSFSSSKEEDFVAPVTAVIAFFRHLEKIPGRAKFVVTMYAKYIAALYGPAAQILAIIQANPTLLDEHKELVDVRRWCGQIQAIQMAKNPAKGQIEPAIDAREVLGAVFKALVEMRGSKKCAYRECAQPDEKPLAFCAGCNVAGYCSKECQTAAWKLAGAPHQPICKSIKKLRAALKLADGVAWTRALGQDNAVRVLVEKSVGAKVDVELGADVLDALNLSL